MSEKNAKITAHLSHCARCRRCVGSWRRLTPSSPSLSRASLQAPAPGFRSGHLALRSRHSRLQEPGFSWFRRVHQDSASLVTSVSHKLSLQVHVLFRAPKKLVPYEEPDCSQIVQLWCIFYLQTTNEARRPVPNQKCCQSGLLSIPLCYMLDATIICKNSDVLYF